MKRIYEDKFMDDCAVYITGDKWSTLSIKYCNKCGFYHADGTDCLNWLNWYSSPSCYTYKLTNVPEWKVIYERVVTNKVTHGLIEFGSDFVCKALWNEQEHVAKVTVTASGRVDTTAEWFKSEEDADEWVVGFCLAAFDEWLESTVDIKK